MLDLILQLKISYSEGSILPLKVAWDTVIIVFRTSSVKDTFEELDSIIEYAAERGIAVMLHIVINSKKFSEVIRTSDNVIPDYTNKTQLIYAVKLLKKVICLIIKETIK